MDDLQFDEETEESTRDRRFSRISSYQTFSESVPGLEWICYPGVRLSTEFQLPDTLMKKHLLGRQVLPDHDGCHSR